MAGWKTLFVIMIAFALFGCTQDPTQDIKDQLKNYGIGVKTVEDSVCGNAYVDVGEECDTGGFGNFSLVATQCANGAYCDACKCTQKQVTPNCGDGVLSDREECDVGGTPYAADKNGDGKPDAYPDPCIAPKVCGNCLCQEPKGTCGNGLVEGIEKCDLGGLNGIAVKADSCPTGSRCVNCTCIYDNRQITPRCGDGFVTDTEECDLGGTRNAPDNNGDGLPDSFADPCPQPKECLDCKCLTPGDDVITCNPSQYPGNSQGTYTFIKGIKGEFTQYNKTAWGTHWCAPTSASYSFRYWFDRGYSNFLDYYKNNASWVRAFDSDGDGKLSDIEATEALAHELGRGFMGTSPTNGTNVDKFVSGLKGFINVNGYNDSFIIKKYGGYFGTDQAKILEDYRRELEACEDVLIGIQYPAGGGHAMVGKSINKNANKDGSYNISLVDPGTGKDYQTVIWPDGTMTYGGGNVTMYRVIAVSPSTPAVTTCGDHSLQQPNSQGVVEQCEMGVDVCPKNQYCDYKTCQCRYNYTYCGDSVIQTPNMVGQNEECEVGKPCPQGKNCDFQTCTCIATAIVPVCGDGVLAGNEQCETGRECTSPTAACNLETCACVEKCGNGACETGETASNCPHDCQTEQAVCLDGTLQAGEECEANHECTDLTKKCDYTTCKCVSKCGDGVCETGETYASCPHDCTQPIVCGDGVIAGNEECEDNIPCESPFECTNCQCSLADRDHDGYPDSTDNCPDVANDQSDLDGDGIGDPCDPVPVNCGEKCTGAGYAQVAGADITQSQCQAYSSEPPTTCKTTCVSLKYFTWNWQVSDYSCCCRKVEYKDCSDCPGQNPVCPQC